MDEDGFQPKKPESLYDEHSPRLGPFENAAIAAWIASREQDAILTSSDLEGLVRILRIGTPIMIWNGERSVPLRADMLSVGEVTGKVFLGEPV